MARTSLSRSEIVETLGEFAGIKAGLALTEAEIRSHLPDAEELKGPPEAVIRLRHEDFDFLVRSLLYALGVLRYEASDVNPSMQMLEALNGGPRELEFHRRLQEELISCVEAGILQNPGQPIDFTPIAKALSSEFGAKGLESFVKFYDRMEDHMQGSFYSGYQRVEWKDLEELDNLYASRSLKTQHGTYLDQRFIDYLVKNDESLDRMHWRKFEGLAAEYFERKGFKVEVGPGTNDDGVDVRVWKDRCSDEGALPTMLIQCKRQKDMVGKAVVKALWADVQHESAESGLIVTTSTLAPGAETTRVARGYNIEAAERNRVVQWLHQLRSTGTGLFLPR